MIDRLESWLNERRKRDAQKRLADDVAARLIRVGQPYAKRRAAALRGCGR